MNGITVTVKVEEIVSMIRNVVAPFIKVGTRIFMLLKS